MTDVDVRQDARWVQVLEGQGRLMTWLAARTGVSVPTVYAYKRGIRRTPTHWLERVALALGVSVEDVS